MIIAGSFLYHGFHYKGPRINWILKEKCNFLIFLEKWISAVCSHDS
jgi:hypothetical protein